METDMLYGLSVEEKDKIGIILMNSESQEQKWQKISKEVFNPNTPFDTQEKIYYSIYQDCKNHYMSIPSDEDIASCFLGSWMNQLGITSVKGFHAWSRKNLEKFWQTAISELNIPFAQKPNKIVDLSKGVCYPKWLPNAQYNIADACLSACPTKTAIVFADENGNRNSWTYERLTKTVNQVANGLQDIGINIGDRIAIDMMMTAESVAIYLGIIKAGAEVVSIADSFAIKEIKVRLEASDAKLIFTQDYIDRAGKKIPMYEKVKQSTSVKIISVMHENSEVILDDGDVSWYDFLSDNNQFTSIKFSADKIINILFSSGTTGMPKAIPWDQSVPIKSATDALIYMDTQEGDVWVWPTNLGWMMGPWLVFASLMNKATIGLFYGTPNTKEFVVFVEKINATKLGVIPSIVKTWRSTNVIDECDWSSIKLFASTAESSNESDMLYLSSRAGYKPIIEYCGGTEIGGAYLTSTLVQPNMPSAFATPTFGLGLELIDDSCKVVNGVTEGEVTLIPPSFGLSVNLLNKDHHNAYYDGMPIYNGEQLRRHGDQIQRLSNGYYRSLGRADDTMNLGGVKTSSAEIEKTVNRLNDIYESAAIAVEPKGGGPSLLVLFIVAVESDIDRDLLRKQAQQEIKDNLNPLFRVFDVVLVDKLPRTASNKIMRRTLRGKYILE